MLCLQLSTDIDSYPQLDIHSYPAILYHPTEVGRTLNCTFRDNDVLLVIKLMYFMCLGVGGTHTNFFLYCEIFLLPSLMPVYY